MKATRSKYGTGSVEAPARVKFGLQSGATMACKPMIVTILSFVAAHNGLYADRRPWEFE
jgi:hypothetical protein